MNIWIPVALMASSLVSPIIASPQGTADEAIIAAKKEVAEAQAHLEQLLASRETGQLTVTAVNNTSSSELAWTVVSSSDQDFEHCADAKSKKGGHGDMHSFHGKDKPHHGDRQRQIEIQLDRNECDMEAGPGGMSFRGMMINGDGEVHEFGSGMPKGGPMMRGMFMGGGDDNGCDCSCKGDAPKAPHRGMMFPGMDGGKAPHFMRQRMMKMFGGQSGDDCPHGEAPHGGPRGMMFGGNHGQEHGGRGNHGDHGRGHGEHGQGHGEHGQGHGDQGWNKMGGEHGDMRWFMDEDSDDHGQAWWSDDDDDEGKCEGWSDSDECELSFEFDEDEPNWVTGTVTEMTSIEDIDAEIEVLLRRLEADGTETHMIMITDDHDISPEQLQAVIEIELEDNACSASDDSDIDALIREIECSIDADVAAEEPLLKDADVQVRVVDRSPSRIEELEGEVAELRELVESLVKELNKR